MADLLQFTNWACADAQSAATCRMDMGAGSDASPGRLGRPDRPVSSATTHQATDDDPPARKAARVVSYATPDVSSPLGPSAGVPVAQYQAPPAPVMCQFPSSRRRQLSLPLPRFATPDAAPDNVQSPSVATQLFAPFLEDRSSTSYGQFRLRLFLGGIV